MARPRKCRLIQSAPTVVLFKPRGIPATMLEHVTLNCEELEAMRLKDLDGFDQAEAAQEMNVSRATFQRILGSARAKISDALVNGKAIRIQGGDYSIAGNLLLCEGCGHRWRSNNDMSCPKCTSKEITQFTSPRCNGRKNQPKGNKNEAIGGSTMKIAVSTADGRTICGHLGSCSKFFIYDVEDGKTISREIRDVTPVHGPHEGHHLDAHHHGSHEGLAGSLSDCAAVITNGMGRPMAASLQVRGIDPVITAESDPDMAVDLYLKGNLKGKEHQGYCNCGHH